VKEMMLEKGYPSNLLAVRETLETVQSFSDLGDLMNSLRKPEFTVQVLYQSPERKEIAAALWRGYARLLLRFGLSTEALPIAYSLSEFIGGLRVYGGISLAELQQARTDLVHRQLVEPEATAGWLAGLAFCSIYDEDLVEYLKYSIVMEPPLRSLTLTWMMMAWMATGTFTPTMERNRSWLFDVLVQHIEEAAWCIPQAAFLDSYWTRDPEKYAGLRKAFARWAKSRGICNTEAPQPPVRERPKIGIVSSNWRDNHSVRKALLTTVLALRERAEVHLVDTNLSEDSKVDEFDGVVRVTSKPDPDRPGISLIDDSDLGNAKFDLLYFTETFQAEIDTLLHTRRYAPVQMTGYGIPVSTQSPNMDIFLGGSLVENTRSRKGYSEKLVIVPGIGMVSQMREQGPVMEKNPGELRVVVPANLQKLTAEYLATLGKIAKAVPNSRWIFLPNNTAISGLIAGEEILRYFSPDQVQWYTQTNHLYQPILRSADLVLDAIPYSGYTTIIDAISAQVPVMAWQGVHAHERLAAAVAKLGGMPARWLPKSMKEFEEKAIRLLRSPLHRQICRQRIKLKGSRVFQQDASVIADVILEQIPKTTLRKR